MPRKPCYWTRALELELVKFVRECEFIWKPAGNTNHHIKQKYKAYAEFAAKLGPGFTARSVRDRWVNIRSTWHHNLRRVRRSRLTARSPHELYVPCWPLWQPLSFLASVEGHNQFQTHPHQSDFKELSNIHVKEELSEIDLKTDADPRNGNELSPDYFLPVKRQGKRTDRPRRKPIRVKTNNDKCKRIIEDLTEAMKPLVSSCQSQTEQSYWFFGRHVTERLNCMREIDAMSASKEILKILEEFQGCGD